MLVLNSKHSQNPSPHSLYEKRLILDPVNKNKSVIVTPEGAKQAEKLFNKLLKN
ncbi:DUF6429 family protein [Vibrio fortis]|uniref:DUF6429 family protein n=1 Tax=Vibrio fortis TaxID=212667 RepID=UPI003EBE7784